MLITISLEVPGSDKVLEQLRTGPIAMSPEVAGCSADIKELISKNFAVYDNESGELKLIKDTE